VPKTKQLASSRTTAICPEHMLKGADALWAVSSQLSGKWLISITAFSGRSQASVEELATG